PERIFVRVTGPVGIAEPRPVALTLAWLVRELLCHALRTLPERLQCGALLTDSTAGISLPKFVAGAAHGLSGLPELAVGLHALALHLLHQLLQFFRKRLLPFLQLLQQLFHLLLRKLLAVLALATLRTERA